MAVCGLHARVRPRLPASEDSSRGYVGANVFATLSASVWERNHVNAPGVASACCTFLNVARWPRIEGHLMARDLSRSRRHP